jgi:hypothetical protein
MSNKQLLQQIAGRLEAVEGYLHPLSRGFDNRSRPGPRMSVEEVEQAHGFGYNPFKAPEGQVSRRNVAGRTLHGEVKHQAERQERIATAPPVGWHDGRRTFHDSELTRPELAKERRDVAPGKSLAGRPYVDPAATPHYRKGGVVNKTGLAVVHKGELVVPAEVVPKVLKSNAWMNHVRAVRAKHGGTMKEAMKIAKGTYRK